MKKYFFFVICVSILCIFSLQKNDKSNCVCPELYQSLVNENFGPLDHEKILYINVGIDYIPFELLEVFEKLTGVTVIPDIFDSNEILEAKLLAGGAQYDIVFPTAWPHFARQLKAGIYKKIDKTRIDYKIFEHDILARLAEYDFENSYGIPYQFGISGIGIDEKIIDAIAKDAPKDSFAIIFDPVYAKKLSKYRISVYESSDEIFPAVLAYLGLNPETEKEEDIIKASEHLKKIRKYFSKFTSYGFEDLASGNACAALSTSGDILKVKSENKSSSIKFLFPKEGASLWVDLMAIPIRAKHINNIYAFLKFLFHPRVIAFVTNHTSRANVVVDSAKFVNEDLINNKDVYPPLDIRKRCYIEKPLPSEIETLKTRLLTKIKSMDKNDD